MKKDPQEHLYLNFQYERIRKMGRDKTFESYNLYDAYIDCDLGLYVKSRKESKSESSITLVRKKNKVINSLKNCVMKI